MMFGLPYQTPRSVREDMTRLTGMGVTTITIYRLTTDGLYLTNGSELGETLTGQAAPTE